jgi:hypothetical protein
MSLDSLPDELIVEIYKNLLGDLGSFRRLMMTNKRMCRIANGSSLINTPEWVSNRPTSFDLSLDLTRYNPNLCESHGRCAEFHSRTSNKCELVHHYEARQPKSVIRRPPSVSGDDDQSDNDEPTACYYHRLYCMLQARYITFSSLKFNSARLSDRGCVRAFRDFSSGPKISALVELELNRCDITLDWLNTILNELDHITYLSLNDVSFTDPSLLVEPKFMASKKLELLRIAGDRTCRINDSIFLYFLENFPAVRLDLTGTRVEYHKRIIQRFYSSTNTLDLFSSKPSEYIFTFPMVLLYLKKYQAIAEHFIADDTDITLASLKRILQDEALKHLQVSVRNCPMITQFEQTRLTDQVDEQDLRRVVF